LFIKETPTAAAPNGSQLHANGSAANGSAAKAAPAYSRKNPFPAALLENHPLNAKGSAKDTRHIALSLLGSGLEYRAGDALGIQPRNCYELVDRLILRLNCLGNEKIVVDGGEEIALRSALLNKLDLRRGSDKLLQRLREACRNGGEQRRLRDLASGEEEKLKAYLSERDLLEVLEDFPHTRLDAQELASVLPKLPSRLYSIASSPKENPGEVHLTVGVVRYLRGGRLRRGTASTFLAERVPLGLTVPVFVQPAAHFALPADGKTPVIMVGPGTGVAPFRSFLQERRANGDSGKNWLFFGDQRRSFDFIYGEEFAGMQASGHLTRLDLAFSRDQEEKVYVQDRMLERSKELFAWLEEGAHFYVCGDAKRMAKDVEAALLQVIAKEGGKGPDEAKAYLETLKAGKRYQRDVY
jgi:sulfite reductase (NADPH) flavoprotein alpha-component